MPGCEKGTTLELATKITEWKMLYILKCKLVIIPEKCCDFRGGKMYAEPGKMPGFEKADLEIYLYAPGLKINAVCSQM